MTYMEILRWGEEALSACGIAESRIDAWYLFSHCFGMEKGSYLLRMKETADSAGTEAYRELVRKRGERIPLQHLLGCQEFMGLEFLVNGHVLIPRQDTETLVEAVLQETEAMTGPVRILDLCTGSGCIGISLAWYLKRACSRAPEVTLSDISPEALEVAAENVRRLDCGDVCRIVCSDLFREFEGQQFDRIVSNPPYIPSGEIGSLEPEVRVHEPRLALDGSGDGLACYRRIGREASEFLVPGGVLWLEIGWDQGPAVTEILAKEGFAEIEVRKDLAGKDRVVRAVYPGNE